MKSVDTYPAPGCEDPSLHLPPIRYRVRVGDTWLPEMIDHKDTSGGADNYAGNGSPISYLAIDMRGWYQVRTQAHGWLPKVYVYNPSDLNNGCAGDGSPITGVRCFYETENSQQTGMLGIEYAVANVGGKFFPPMVDLKDTALTDKDFAGDGGTISAFRARLVQFR